MISVTYKTPNQPMSEYRGPKPDAIIDINHGTAVPSFQALASLGDARPGDVIVLRLNDRHRRLSLAVVDLDNTFSMVGERTLDNSAYTNAQFIGILRFSSSIRANDPNGFPVEVVLNASPRKDTNDLTILVNGKAE